MKPLSCLFILVLILAGNSGPGRGKVTNVAPWILSVAASTNDRRFLTKVQLGNGLIYKGVSVNLFDSKDGKYPVVYGGDVPNAIAGFTSFESRYCRKNSLNPTLVNGKIVLCDELSNGESVFLSGAAGTIMRDVENRDNTKPFPLPATYLDGGDGARALNYIRLTRSPTATILKSFETTESRTPYVASFSSRGPNSITPDILKPDITAPAHPVPAPTSPFPAPPDEYHHIQFVQTWTPTFCKYKRFMKCISPLPPNYANNFSMHGLWPAWKNGTTIAPDGGTPPAIPGQVYQELEPLMNIHWAAISRKWQQKYDFWKHEWDRHGYMGSWTEARNYFMDGINVRQKTNLLGMLQTGGIGFNIRYTKQQIIAAFGESYGVNHNIYVSCSDGGDVLKEILICLNKSTLDYISCPHDTNTRGCNKNTLQIPVYNNVIVHLGSVYAI